MLTTEPRLYNDGSDHFAWLKSNHDPNTYPRLVRSVPMQINALVYAERDDGKKIGCFIAVPTDSPVPSAEVFAKAVLEASARLRAGGGTEMYEGMTMEECEVVTSH